LALELCIDILELNAIGRHFPCLYFGEIYQNSL